MVTETEQLVRSGRCLLLRDRSLEEVSRRWLRPDHWEGRARPVVTGGRGGAWFVKTPLGELVLRRYRRGGIAARFSSSGYLFMGYRRTRAHAEFRLLQRLHDLGLPVPQPIAALACRSGLTYRASILLRRLPGASPLPEQERLDEPQLWEEVGRVLRQFHDAGLDHRDLNCDNILVAGQTVSLIDFDRCCLRAPNRRDTLWQRRNLRRLYRSVNKRCEQLSERSRQRLWQCLLAGYRAEPTGQD